MDYQFIFEGLDASIHALLIGFPVLLGRLHAAVSANLIILVVLKGLAVV